MGQRRIERTCLMTVNIEAGNVPVGGCIPWLSPIIGSPQPALPPGWEYADGGAVTTAGSSLFGVNKPPLMATVENPGVVKRFIRGASTNVTYGGGTALVQVGVDTHAHGGTTNSAGTHSHGIGSHTHPITADGTHSHGGNSGVNNLTTPTGAHTAGPFLFPFDGHTHTISGDGNHSHGGNTQSSSGSTDSTGSHAHAFGTGAGSNVPATVEMAWIIRVL
jgi:hypothetical protein